ncbi:MAG: hypothetical protein AB7L71_12025 [Vicinamibacterales bacterium]
MLKLTDAQTRSLLTQPETGMGYQEVEATLRNNQTEKGIVYNGELIFLGNESRSVLKLASYPAVLKLASNATDEIRSLRVLRMREGLKALSTREASGTIKKSAGPAKDAPTEKTKADEVFKRFSAYENDRRITAEKGLLPGSYATTEDDAKNVKTGKEAVARYALANPEPASYVFTIKPTKDTDIQRGTVEPANGQPGGGAEVIFTNGTTTNTVTLPPVKLPDE